MIKIYMESKGSAELVAIARDEEIYEAIHPILEKRAGGADMFLTESVVDTDIEELDNG